MLITHNQIPLSRIIFGKRISNKWFGNKRCYYNPPRKSFNSSLTPVTYFWNEKVPINLKYGVGILSLAMGVANIHHNILITVFPPIAVVGYLAYKKAIESNYKKEVTFIKPKSLSDVSDDEIIDLKPYDETSVDNVMKGIENSFDFFKTQIVEIIEQVIKNHVSKGGNNNSLFLDTNNQFIINVFENNIENFIVLSIELDSKTVKFIKFGIPFYKDKSIKKQRLGVIEAYLMEIPTEEQVEKYKMKLKITPYKRNSTPDIIIDTTGDISGKFVNI